MITSTSTHSQSQNSEIDLLLLCTYPQITNVQKERLRELAQHNIDWLYLISLAYQHNLMPLVYQQLKATCVDLVPSKILSQLRLDFIANTAHNMALTGELLKLLNLFQEQSISVLSFKGALLAQLAYGDLSLRQFADLDLLIQESEVINAHKLLLAQGYQPQCPLTNSQIQVYVKLHYELMYWNEAKDITIDLHWSIFPKHFSFSPPSQLIWSKLGLVSLENRKVQTLTIEVLVVFLCAHAAKHDWCHLSLICELAHLLQRYSEIDWILIESYLGKLGTRSMVLLTFSLTQDIYGIDLPARICQQIKSKPIIAKLSTQIKKQLFFPINQSQDNISSTSFYFQTIECWPDRCWYWINIVITPTPIELNIIPLPAILFFFYYPIRLVRLSWKYLKTLITRNVNR